MNHSAQFFLDEFEASKDSLLEELFSLIRIPSISAKSAHAPDSLKAFEWINSFLSDAGFATTRWDTTSNPVLFAEHCKAGPDAPTVLFYNHYDVQPVEPLEKWHSEPFAPEIRDGEIYARGAADNKGQCFYALAAVRQMLAREGALPVNLKWVIEGDEETGSGGFSGILQKYANELSADYLFVIDTQILEENSPEIGLGLRGMCAATVTVTGAREDLHSGSHGGIAPNANHGLVKILASLHDDTGRVTIPGFYDDVQELPEEVRAVLAMDFDAAEYEKKTGAKPVGGEQGFSPLESAWIRPTVEVNGVSGGYAGEGFKTVIPAVAVAKVSCRLVPNQDPKDIAAKLKRAIEQAAPEGIDVSVEIFQGSGRALFASPDAHSVSIARDVFTEVFGTPCKLTLEGGSIPVITELAKVAQSEVVCMGYEMPTDTAHAPNEHFGVKRLQRGYATVSRILEKLGDRS